MHGVAKKQRRGEERMAAYCIHRCRKDHFQADLGMDGRIMHETRAGLGFVGRVRATGLIVSHLSRRLSLL
jgi:hypothetical protein